MPKQGQDVATICTRVVDFRDLSEDVVPPKLRALARPGALVMTEEGEIEPIREGVIKAWIDQQRARAGGQVNTAGPIARCGLGVTALGNLGAGTFSGLDPHGKYYADTLDLHRVTPVTWVEREAQTGMTFIIGQPGTERPGIVYSPNANLKIDLALVSNELDRIRPTVAHFMYLGLAGERVDRDLPQYARRWREDFGCIVGADTHTLTPDLTRNTQTAARVNPHTLIPSILPQLDLFFCSLDEAKLITYANGIDIGSVPFRRDRELEGKFAQRFLNEMYREFARTSAAPPLFGITLLEGAWFKYGREDPVLVPNRYLVRSDNKVLVGAGDSQRAGLLAYISAHAGEFKSAKLNCREALTFASLVATLTISGPLDEATRFTHLPSRGFNQLLRVVRKGADFNEKPLGDLLDAVTKA